MVPRLIANIHLKRRGISNLTCPGLSHVPYQLLPYLPILPHCHPAAPAKSDGILLTCFIVSHISFISKWRWLYRKMCPEFDSLLSSYHPDLVSPGLWPQPPNWLCQCPFPLPAPHSPYATQHREGFSLKHDSNHITSQL